MSGRAEKMKEMIKTLLAEIKTFRTIVHWAQPSRTALGTLSSEEASPLQFASLQREITDQYAKARDRWETTTTLNGQAKRSFWKVEQNTCEQQGLDCWPVFV